LEGFAMRRGRTRGRSRGQTLVEFALILPVFLLTFFGAIEFSLIIASIGTYNFAVRDGARVGSILGRTDPNVDSKILSNIIGHVSGVVMAQPTEIDIYRSTSNGACLNAQSGAATSVTVDDATCAKGVYNSSGTLVSGGWVVNNRNDALSSADYIGVRVVFRYTFLTGFIATVGTSLTLSATSAQRIEPQDFTGLHHRPATTAAGRLAPAPGARVAPAGAAPGSMRLWQAEAARKEAAA
jgi:Flp pilus assembly protein TadG